MKLTYTALICSLILIVGSCKKEDGSGAGGSSGNANNLSVGKSANDLLAASKFSSIKIEIVYMPGFQPDPASLTNLSNFITALANKPSGVQISSREIPASGKPKLTLADITAIELANRTVFNNGSSLGIFLLYADADYTEDRVLGIAYKNTSMAVFAKTIMNNSGGINQVSRMKLESTGLLHEMGHLFGLVNLGTNMQVAHEDTGNAKHCTNISCLMYFATQSNMMGGILLGGPIPELDANCRNDLRANGGK